MVNRQVFKLKVIKSDVRSIVSKFCWLFEANYRYVNRTNFPNFLQPLTMDSNYLYKPFGDGGLLTNLEKLVAKMTLNVELPFEFRI